MTKEIFRSIHRDVLPGSDLDSYKCIELNVEPVAKPRMTRRDQWLSPQRPVVARYWAYKHSLLKLLGSAYKPPTSSYWLVFFLPMPKSWSQKKRDSLAGTPHQSGRADKDNLEKGFLDAFGEDRQIWDGRVTKLWWHEGKVELYFIR